MLRVCTASRWVVIAAIFVVLVSAAGCGAPKDSLEPTVQAGGFVHGHITYDAPLDPEESKLALAHARKSMGELVQFWYEYEDTKPDFAPSTLEAFVRESTCTVVPVFEYSEPASSATSIYDVTRQKPNSYVLLSFLDGELVAACDWDRPAVDGSWLRGPWFSFYGLGGLGFPEAIEKLQSHFGDKRPLVRVVAVPRGYWVVGRASGREKAVFVGHQGHYEDDPGQRVYSLEEVLAYGAPHANGE